MRSLDIAGTGMQAQNTNVEVISNNIANLTTTGFKRRRAEFQDLIYQDLRRVGRTVPTPEASFPSGAQVGLGVKTAAIYPINEQGTCNRRPIPWTSRSRDTAISRSRCPTVTRLHARRNIRPRRRWHDRDGGWLHRAARPANSGGATGVTINTSGQVQVTLQGQTVRPRSASFRSRYFRTRRPAGDGRRPFPQTAASGAPVAGNPGVTGFGTVMQGFVETSNVNIVAEITNLITAQRAYEMNSKVISAGDEMMSTLTNLR